MSKGLMSIEIPTKSYIKAYVQKRYGDKPIMLTKGSQIARKLYDLLQHETNERKLQFGSKDYNAMMKLYIPVSTFRKRGHCLSETNIQSLNLFIESIVKEKFYYRMDDLMEQFPSIENNLPHIRKTMGIDIEAWSDDAMKKAYYRYRIGNNGKILK